MSRDRDFEGKVAVVTGGARGMGEATSRILAARGASVVVADLNQEEAKKTAASIAADTGARVVAAAIDVRSKEDHERVADLALEELGGLHAWVNNAGIFPEAPVLDLPLEQLHNTLAINLDGVLLGSQAAARRMQPGGAIVNMASVSGLRVRAGRAAYSISKAAVVHLTRFLGYEFGDLGIRVNAIAPGFVETPMTEWVKERPGAWEAMEAQVPLGRMGKPEEISNAVAFLLSEEASYITGTTLVVDGARMHG